MPNLLDLLNTNRLLNPQTSLGLGLIGASALGKEEPGFVTESRQVLRNLQQPSSFGQTFGQTVSGLQQPFLPLLKQQSELGIQDVAQRAKALFPATVGLQGPALSSMEEFLRERLVPTQQAFLGNLGLQGIGTQQSAASRILETARPDPFKEALGGLGGALILGQVLGGRGTDVGRMPGQATGGLDLGSLLRTVTGPGGGGGTQGPFDSTNPLGQILNQVMGGGGGIIVEPGAASAPAALSLFKQLFPGGFSTTTGLPLSTNTALLSQLTPSVSDLFAGQAASLGTPIGGQIPVLNNAGQVIGNISPTGAVTSATGQPLGSVSIGQGAAAGQTGFSGLLGAPGFSSLQGLLSGLASAGLGAAAGGAIGSQLPETQIGATAAGAGGGAAAGFLAGGPIGAALGGVLGAITGLTGSRSASHAEKAQRLAADQAANRSNSGVTSTWWTSSLGAAGFQDLDGWDTFTSGLVGKPGYNSFSYSGYSGSLPAQDAIAKVGGGLLLKEIQKTSPQISTLDDVPGFRDRYISYLMDNYRIESGGSVVPPSSPSQFGGLLINAGLRAP